MPAPRDARSFPHREIGVTAREDFVGRMPDGTLIHSDRETGREDDDYETEPRMAAYVLWAVEYHRMSVDAISTELVFLKTGATKTYRFFEEQLREMLEMIPERFWRRTQRMSTGFSRPECGWALDRA